MTPSPCLATASPPRPYETPASSSHCTFGASTRLRAYAMNEYLRPHGYFLFRYYRPSIYLSCSHYVSLLPFDPRARRPAFILYTAPRSHSLHLPSVNKLTADLHGVSPSPVPSHFIMFPPCCSVIHTANHVPCFLPVKHDLSRPS